jgi:hypothetical protein
MGGKTTVDIGHNWSTSADNDPIVGCSVGVPAGSHVGHDLTPLPESLIDLIGDALIGVIRKPYAFALEFALGFLETGLKINARVQGGPTTVSLTAIGWLAASDGQGRRKNSI